MEKSESLHLAAEYALCYDESSAPFPWALYVGDDFRVRGATPSGAFRNLAMSIEEQQRFTKRSDGAEPREWVFEEGSVAKHVDS